MDACLPPKRHACSFAAVCLGGAPGGPRGGSDCQNFSRPNCNLAVQCRDKNIHKKAMVGYLTTSHELGDEDLELPFISFEGIVTATDILSEGGFGKIYKGMLGQKKEVATKRLGQGSGYDTEDFRLLNCSTETLPVFLVAAFVEKLLIYEYLYL